MKKKETNFTKVSYLFLIVLLFLIDKHILHMVSIKNEQILKIIYKIILSPVLGLRILFVFSASV